MQGKSRLCLILKQKSWLWSLTFGFASENYTTINNTLYFPKGFPPIDQIIRHEEIHEAQQQDVGVVKFILLYLFAFSFLYNPWRWKWEFEAYTKGSGYSEEETISILKSKSYGWLVFGGEGEKDI